MADPKKQDDFVFKNTVFAPGPIDPLQRLKELFYFLAKLLITSFQNITVLIIGGVVIVLAILYFFFSLFGLT